MQYAAEITFGRRFRRFTLILCSCKPRTAICGFAHRLPRRNRWVYRIAPANSNLLRYNHFERIGYNGVDVFGPAGTETAMFHVVARVFDTYVPVVVR